MNYEAEKRYIGDLSQLFHIRTFRMVGGRAEGTLCTEIHNGSGLCLTIAADRCMDLQHVRFHDCNIGYINDCGVVAPTYFDANGAEFLRSFTAGMLTTCGLSHMGSPCEDNGETLGLHGRIANTPASEYSVTTAVEDGVPTVYIRGKMRQSRLFGEHFELTREYKIRYGCNKITMTDTVENTGYRPWEHMQLYHFNFGYPLVCEDTRIYLPSAKVEPRTAFAAQGLSCWDTIESPTDNAEEACYYHTLRKAPDGHSSAAIYNHRRNLGVAYTFDADLLDTFVEWKLMGSGEYVIGLEPSNAPVDGRDKARVNGQLKFLQPQEKKQYTFTIRFLQGEQELEAVKVQQNQLVSSKA